MLPSAICLRRFSFHFLLFFLSSFHEFFLSSFMNSSFLSFFSTVCPIFLNLSFTFLRRVFTHYMTTLAYANSCGVCLRRFCRLWNKNVNLTSPSLSNLTSRIAFASFFFILGWESRTQYQTRCFVQQELEKREKTQKDRKRIISN